MLLYTVIAFGCLNLLGLWAVMSYLEHRLDQVGLALRTVGQSASRASCRVDEIRCRKGLSDTY